MLGNAQLSKGNLVAAEAAFAEALQPQFKKYSQQVVKNAQALAAVLVKKNFNLVTGGTDNHLMLIDLRSKNLTGKKAEEALIQADITINKNMVPFDTQSPMVTSGMRIGTPAITPATHWIVMERKRSGPL